MPDQRRRACRLAVRRAALLLVLSLLLGGLMPAVARAQRYVNTVNKRFATVSNGPQSSLIVDVPAAATRETVSAAIGRRVRADWTARARAAAPQIERMRRAGLLKGRGVIPVSTLVAVRQGGRMVTPPRATRQAGGGTLTFTYTGWSPQEEAVLRQFAAAFYPRIQNLYGAPAWTGSVEVRNLGDFDSGTATQVQRLAFGAYDVSNRQILLPTYDSAESQAQAFLLLMIHAFHGPTYFAYDAWEQGFARAAASVIARDPALGFTDASANSFYSLLKFYDLLNQPPLGNPTFFPPSQRDVNLSVGVFSNGKMFFPRLGMSGAAWLKAYIENPNFFRDFNQAYYAQFGQNGSLAGNVPALKAIAAGLLPAGVEGSGSFDRWYEQQYVLDTSVSLGNKLYAFVNPSEPELVEGQNQQSTLISLVYFRTKADGDEELLRGRAYATYLDASNARLFLGAGSEQADIAEGEGFLTTFLSPAEDGSDATRVTMDFHAGNETARTYTTFGLKGDFQVLVLGDADGRSVTVNQTTLPPVQSRSKSATIRNDAAAVTLAGGINDLAVTTVTVSDGTNNTTYRFNTGDGLYYALVRADFGGGTASVSQTFSKGLHLVSFPVRPFQTDVAAALNLSPTDFLLSYWGVNAAGRQDYQTFEPGRPTIAPLQPGRGYWLKIDPQDGTGQRTVQMTGVAPSRDTDLTVSLPFGWNLIGTPFDQPVGVNDLRVQFLQNPDATWEGAVAGNLVAAQPFAFTPTTGYGTVDTLQPWQGYWVRVLVPNGVTVVIPGPNAARARAVTRRASSPGAAKPDWSLRLRARVKGNDALPAAAATLGAARGASRAFDNRWDREAPPAIVPAVSVEFPHADWGAASGRYVADFRDPAEGRSTWDLTVTSPVDGDVLLTWEGLGSVSRRTRLTLVDKETGTRTPLRGRSSYAFTAVAGKSRAFEMVAEPERSAPLSLSDVTVVRTRGVKNGFTFGYSVSDAADVTIEIKALGGRTLRRLGGGRTQGAGRQSVVWDGRSAEGAPVPTGPYTLSITARGQDGAPVRQMRPIFVLN